MDTRANRMAPRTFARTAGMADPSALALWRGLKLAYVPGSGQMVDILHGNRTTQTPAAGITPNAQANGPSVRLVNQLLHADEGVHVVPLTTPLSVVAFLVRHTASTAQQHVICTGESGVTGWSFKLDCANGKIGFLRWTIAQDGASTLGTVPVNVPCVIGLSHNGSTARCFQDGVFESVASGVPGGGSWNRVAGARGGAGADLEPTLDTSYHVIYAWNRTLSDGEMLRLWRDPWAPVRPAQRWTMAQSSAVVTSGARSFAAMIG